MLNGKKVLISVGLILFVLYMYNLVNPFSSKVTEAPIATKDVLHDSFAQDWANIRQAIDPKHEVQNFLVTDFRLMYAPTGELKELNWTFQTPPENGKQTIFSVYRDESFTHYEISINIVEPLQIPVQGQVTMDDFVKMFTPEMIAAMTPHGVGVDGVSMTLAQSYQKLSEDNAKQMPNSYFEIRNDKVVGPVKQGEGYLMTVFPLHQESGGSMSGMNPRYYLLGGFGDYKLADPSP